MNIRRVKILVIVLLAVFTCSFLLYEGRNIAYATLNSWKLIPTPERFTELYFENPSALPRETIQGQPISFSFTIHNEEGVTTTYPYVVYFEYPFGRIITFSSSSVTLASDASTTINISHTFLASNEQGEVIVELSQLDQQIDFLLPYNN